MRIRLEEDAFRRGRALIRAEAHPRERDLTAQIVLGGHEVAGAHAALVLDDKVDRRFLWRDRSKPRDLGERLPGELLQPRGLEGHEEHALCAARGEVEVLPLLAWGTHLAGDPFAHRRIAEANEPRLEPALLHPRRH